MTAKDHENDRVVGLRLGADDYVVKPFSAAELAARIASVLRRAGTGRTRERLDFDGLSIDLVSREVVVDEEPIELLAPRVRATRVPRFVPAPGVHARGSAGCGVGPLGCRQKAATVTEHIRRVRQRTEAEPDRPRWIHTVRGYRFDP